MTGIMKSVKYQHSELTGNHSGVRMKFWGVCCVGGKAYKQVVNYRFHLTMAVLDPKSYDRDVRDRTVTLSVIQHGQVFLLCVLKHGDIQQVSLNLIFDKGDDVTFSIGGYGTVHLTGYQLIDSSDSGLDVDNEHYCPVAELGSEKQIQKRLQLPVNGVEKKNRAKEKAKLMEAMIIDSGEEEEVEEEEKADDDDDDEDDDDSDFSIKEIMQSEDDSSSSDDDDDEDDDDEIDEEEIKDVLEDVYEMETPPKPEVYRKRKHEKMSVSQKRSKKSNSEFEENDDVCLRENKSDSEKDDLNSSIGNTPMPKMAVPSLDGSSKEKKKSKKRKRLSEISNLGKLEKTDDGDNLPKDISTPKQQKRDNKAANPIIKLEGGVEVQDVVIGRGPVAANGKIVSVFYIGRLEDKTIFDSRVPPKKPFSFKLGVPEVIKGLDIGIKGMRVGGQRKMKIPPGMGYGSKVLPDNVPRNSTLFFSVDLLSVN